MTKIIVAFNNQFME